MMDFDPEYDIPLIELANIKILMIDEIDDNVTIDNNVLVQKNCQKLAS